MHVLFLKTCMCIHLGVKRHGDYNLLSNDDKKERERGKIIIKQSEQNMFKNNETGQKAHDCSLYYSWNFSVNWKLYQNCLKLVNMCCEW